MKHLPLLVWFLVGCVAMYVMIACSSSARAQAETPDIYHRDFGTTTCYYALNSTTGEVGALSCVK
jgi:hypothetical protein